MALPGPFPPTNIFLWTGLEQSLLPAPTKRLPRPSSPTPDSSESTEQARITELQNLASIFIGAGLLLLRPPWPVAFPQGRERSFPFPRWEKSLLRSDRRGDNKPVLGFVVRWQNRHLRRAVCGFE